jgi:hypothetical protein
MAQRSQPKNERKKMKKLGKTGLTLGMVVILGLLTVATGLASHGLDLFELDRDALENGSIDGDDWELLYNGGGNAGDFTGIISDTLTLNFAGTQFQAGGSKDDLDIGPGGATGQHWKWEPGEPLDKDDITNAYAAAYIYQGSEVCPEGVPSGDDLCTEPGDLIVYFGLDRFANNGSAQVGFWFLQNEIGLTNIKDGGGYQFSGLHAIGDVLVQSNFSQGGVIDTISVYEWVGAGGSDGTLDLVYSAQDCVAGADPAALACATVNQGDTDSPWPFSPKFGTDGIFPQGSFFEGGINISALVPDAGCFTGFLAETRSSTPFDARLKDFALGDFELCDANIQIEPDDVNEVGEDHTFDVTVSQVFAGVESPAADGTEVTVELSNAGASYEVSNNTCETGTVDGQCSVTFSSDIAGTVTGHASATVSLLGDELFVETDGTGDNSDDAVKHFVDASVSISPDAVNAVGEPHIFTIVVTPDYPAGVTLDSVSITPTGDTGYITAEDCDEAGSGTALTCDVTVNSASYASASIGADAVLEFSDDSSAGSATVSRSTDGVSPNSGAATKHWVDASVSIYPDGVNEVGGQHVFTIEVTPYYPAGVTLDSVSISATGDTGFITSETCDEAGAGTALSCEVTVNSASATSASIGAAVVLGFSDDSSGDTATVSRSTDGIAPNSGPAVKHWVDAYVTIEADDANGIGEPHTFTIEVTPDYPAGVSLDSVAVSATGDTGFITSETCDEAGTGTALSCEVTVNSNVAGSASIGAAVDLVFSDDSSADTASVSRSTDGIAPNSGPATKTWIDGSLKWLKHDSQGNLLGGATFEVCRTDDRFGNDIADECVTVLDNAAPDLDSDPGEFELDGLYLGSYTIAETLPPAGYQGDPFVWMIDLTLADPDQVSNYIWINVPAQGCTPGWWKNQGLGAYDDPGDWLAQAVASAVSSEWGNVVDGTTDSLFREVFDLDPSQMQGLPTDLTLLGAVELGGGGFNALARQGTAALLNSLSVAYEYSPEQILQDVHDAFISGDLDNLINLYDEANNRDHSFCPTG